MGFLIGFLYLLKSYFVIVELTYFYFQIDPTLRMPQPHTFLSTGKTIMYEKYLLRKSFEQTNLLPACILWRKKEAFSDGVSSENNSWYKIIQDMVESKITNEQFDSITNIYKQYIIETNEKIIIPHTKEALYYHMIFDKYYPDQYHTIPYYWMPKWINNVSDPSARTLEIYKDDNNLNNNKKNTKQFNIINTNYGTISLPINN